MLLHHCLTLIAIKHCWHKQSRTFHQSNLFRIMQLKCSNSPLNNLPLNDHPYTLQLYINQSYKIHNC
jgi:hypothetical protein